METFNLEYESIEEIYDFAVLKTEFEDGSEQRRLKHSKELLGFRLKSPLCTATQFKAYRDFYNTAVGALTTFYFPNPFDENNNVIVRFDGQLQSTYERSCYYCIMNLKIVH